jgi:hypothetical protein
MLGLHPAGHLLLHPAGQLLRLHFAGQLLLLLPLLLHPASQLWVASGLPLPPVPLLLQQLGVVVVKVVKPQPPLQLHHPALLLCPPAGLVPLLQWHQEPLLWRRPWSHLVLQAVRCVAPQAAWVPPVLQGQPRPWDKTCRD